MLSRTTVVRGFGSVRKSSRVNWPPEAEITSGSRAVNLSFFQSRRFWMAKPTDARST
jgi:hypothetical protein